MILKITQQDSFRTIQTLMSSLSNYKPKCTCITEDMETTTVQSFEQVVGINADSKVLVCALTCEKFFIHIYVQDKFLYAHSLDESITNQIGAIIE